MVNIIDQLCNTPKCTEFFVFTSNQGIKFFQQDFSSVVQIFFQDLFKKFSNSPYSALKWLDTPLEIPFGWSFQIRNFNLTKHPRLTYQMDICVNQIFVFCLGALVRNLPKSKQDFDENTIPYQKVLL